MNVSSGAQSEPERAMNGLPMPIRRLALEAIVGRPLNLPADASVGHLCAHCAHEQATHWLYTEDGDDEPWSWCDECGGRCQFQAFGEIPLLADERGRGEEES